MPSLSRAAGRQAGLSQLGDERWESTEEPLGGALITARSCLRQELNPEYTVPDRCQVWSNKS